MAEVVHVITDLNRGGAEGALYRLIKASAPAVPQAVISLTGPGVFGPRLERLGIPVHALGMRRGWFSLGGFRRLTALLRELDPRAVQTWMYHADLLGGLAARRAGCGRVIWNIRNLALDDVGMATRLVVRLCARLSRRIPASIVTPSSRARDLHVRLGYETTRFRVIANGYDLEALKPDPEARARLRGQWGVADDEVLLGCIARVHPQKDHTNLLVALNRVPDRRCVLVGEGTDRYAGDPRIIALGARDDIPAVMSALDIHVLASASEAFPNVVAEAMACGTPCVVTDVGESAAIVGDTGWVVPPRDPEALAAAIEQAVTEFRDRREMARARIRDHYSIDRMTAEYRALWQDAA